jgi:hypothetical protein
MNEPPTDSPEGAPRLRGRAAGRLHATLALGLALCAVAFWFELDRALSGNALSWAYVFEWPLLGVFALYMWWKLLHPDRSSPARGERGALDPSFHSMLERWEESKLDLERSRDGDGRTP